MANSAIVGIVGGGGSGNATKIRGINVSDTPPEDGQTLVYKSSANEYQPATIDIVTTANKPGIDAVLNNEEISDGLVLSYLFNEGTGTTVNDKTASPVDGDLSSSDMWSVDNVYDDILAFGSDDRIEIPHDSKNNIETLTIAFAIRTDSSASYSTIFVKGDPSKYPYGFYLGYPSSGKLLFQCGDGPTEPYAVTTLNYNNDEWYRVIVTRAQGESLKIYVNGILRSETTDTTSEGGTLSSGGIVVGQDSGYGHQYFGKMAYLHMWNRVLSGAPGSVGDPATGEIAAITTDEFLMYR